MTSVYVARGMAFRLVGDFARAVKDFTKAVTVDPTNTNALIHRAALYFDMGEHEGALQDLDRILALNPRMFNALGIELIFWNKWVDTMKPLRIWAQ